MLSRNFHSFKVIVCIHYLYPRGHSPPVQRFGLKWLRGQHLLDVDALFVPPIV